MVAALGVGTFEFHVPLEKTWEGEGELWFEGVASSEKVDLQSDRMSAEGIESMARCSPLDLLPDHKAGALQELGLVEKCVIVDGRLVIRGRLYPDLDAVKVLCQRVSEGRRYQLSVGGRVKRAHREPDSVLGRDVRVIDEVVLDHVALCRKGHAANDETYLSVIAKAAEGVVREGAGLRRLAGALSRVCRALWRSGAWQKESGQSSDAAGDEDDLAQGIEELESHLAQAEAELAEAEKDLGTGLDAGERGAQGGCEDVVESEADPGCRRSLELPERSRRETANLWKGVL